MTLTLLSTVLGDALGCDVMAMEAIVDPSSSFTGYFMDLLFVQVQIYLWPAILLTVVAAGIIAWLVMEVIGYRAALKSWSELTNDLADDEFQTRREAYTRYMQWRRGRVPGSSLPRDFAGISDRPQRGGVAVDPMVSSETQTEGTYESPMDVDQEGEREEEESELAKRQRYLHQSLEESSDTELWFQIHHHDSMEDDTPPNNPIDVNQIEPTLEDMVAATQRARRIYYRRRAELLDAGDQDGLEVLDRNYGWVNFV